jgi:hypothetical protein
MDFSKLATSLGNIAAIFAQFDPDPATRAVATVLPTVIATAQGIADPATRQANINQGVEVAAAVADNILSGGAKKTFETYLPALPALVQAFENLFGIHAAAVAAAAPPA